jgi:WD40 repeat protein
VALNDHTRGLAFSPDGKTLAISYLSIGKPRFEFWDTATWKVRATAPADTRKNLDFHRPLVYSPDGKMIAAAPLYSKPTPKIVDLFDADGKLLRDVPMQSLKVLDLAFSPDGKTLAAHLNDYSLVFIDPATGEVKKP